MRVEFSRNDDGVVIFDWAHHEGESDASAVTRPATAQDKLEYPAEWQSFLASEEPEQPKKKGRK